MFGGLSSALSSGKQKEGTQASASAGGRAVDPTRPDRFAASGENPNKVAVSVTPARRSTRSREALPDGVATQAVNAPLSSALHHGRRGSGRDALFEPDRQQARQAEAEAPSSC